MDLFPAEPGFADASPVLRDYQLDAAERTRQSFKNGNRRVVVQLDTGGGKTFIMAEIVRKALAKGSRILITAHRRRLVDQMIWTLAKFRIHAGVIMEGRNRWGSPVQVASRDTLRSMARHGAELPRADLCIPDECHTTLSAEYLPIIEQYPFVAGFTATPIRPDGSSLAPFYTDLVSVVKTSRLIKEGNLMAVECYDCKPQGQRRQMGEKVKLVGNPIYHWKKYAEGLPTVVFAAKVAESLSIMERYNEAGIPAEHLDASSTDDERDAVLERIANGKTMVVCNVDVLTEGVDVPALSCCQILRGCNSLRLFKQACGRVMRPHTGKNRAVLIDHSGALHEFGEPHSDFEWTLDDAATLERKAKEKNESSGTMTCPQCFLVSKSAPTCPSCGYVVPRKNKRNKVSELDSDAAILTKFEGSAKHTEQERFERVWTSSLHIAKARGKSVSYAAGVFQGKTKKWPWNVGLSKLPPANKESWAMPAGDWLAHRPTVGQT